LRGERKGEEGGKYRSIAARTECLLLEKGKRKREKKKRAKITPVGRFGITHFYFLIKEEKKKEREEERRGERRADSSVRRSAFFRRLSFKTVGKKKKKKGERGKRAGERERRCSEEFLLEVLYRSKLPEWGRKEKKERKKKRGKG